jgi:hypothetical protein
MQRAWAIKDYIVNIDGNSITVRTAADYREVARATVPAFGKYADQAKNLRCGWASLGDGDMEVIYLYDRGDENFGYAVNLNEPAFSEWGYAPFPVQES